MSLNETPNAMRAHIGFFGRTNAGKSSLVNAVTNQPISVVSPISGTTTDPVKKAMELLPLGPVVIIDTPGFDDEGYLGEKRVEKTNEILAPAIKHIEENLHLSSPTNEFLASLCNISCVYFRKLFTKKFNMPPSKYITMLKIQRAKGLIMGDTVSMADISSSCGFSSIYHFSKVFKEHTGLTPTQFKRQSKSPVK